MRGPQWRRATLLLLILAAVGLALAACMRPNAEQPGMSGVLQQQPSGGAQITVVLPATDLAVGKNQRFLLVLVDPENRVVGDAQVDLAFFKVTGPTQAQLRSSSSTQYRESPGLPGHGVYVARTDFDEAGQWGVAARVVQPGQEATELRVNFDVKDRSSTPTAGDLVPASRTLTGTTASDIEKFSSARPVDPSLYRLSVSDALNEHKPLAVLFATPGFCTSRLCGPSVEVLQALHIQYADRANFIHVEIYKDGRPNQQMELVPPVREWGLTSEPWLFIVGADGRLVDKFEGSITVEESRTALEAALQAAR